MKCNCKLECLLGITICSDAAQADYCGIAGAHFYNNSALVQLQMIAIKRSQSNLRNFPVGFGHQFCIFLFYYTMFYYFHEWKKQMTTKNFLSALRGN